MASGHIGMGGGGVGPSASAPLHAAVVPAPPYLQAHTISYRRDSSAKDPSALRAHEEGGEAAEGGGGGGGHDKEKASLGLLHRLSEQNDPLHAAMRPAMHITHPEVKPYERSGISPLHSYLQQQHGIPMPPRVDAAAAAALPTAAADMPLQGQPLMHQQIGLPALRQQAMQSTSSTPPQMHRTLQPVAAPGQLSSPQLQHLVHSEAGSQSIPSGVSLLPSTPPTSSLNAAFSAHSPKLPGFHSPDVFHRQLQFHSHPLHHLHQDPSPEPSSSLVRSMQQQQHQAMLASPYPMQARTIETRGGPSAGQPSSRRSSVTKIMETDDEEEAHEHAEHGGNTGIITTSASSSASASGASTPTRYAPSMLPHPALMLNSRAPTTLFTPSHSRHSSVPSSPLNKLNMYTPGAQPTIAGGVFSFPMTPGVMTTLVPSPRMQHKTQLQVAGQKTLMARQMAAQYQGEDEDEEMGEAEDEERKQDRMASSKRRAGRKYDQKRKKKKRPIGYASPSPSPTEPSAAMELAAAAAAAAVDKDPAASLASMSEIDPSARSRVRRRPIVPRPFFGDSPQPAAARAKDASEREGTAEESSEEEEEDKLPLDKSCELCGKKHNGQYGGGRFCGAHCARQYSIVHRWEKKQQQQQQQE